MGVAQLFVGRVVGSGIVFLNASIANDKSVLASFGEEIFQSAFELFRPFAGRINVGNANALVGLREGAIVLPHLLLLLHADSTASGNQTYHYAQGAPDKNAL